MGAGGASAPGDRGDGGGGGGGDSRSAGATAATESEVFDDEELALLDRFCGVGDAGGGGGKKSVEMVVWDFDLTVLSVHSFGMRIHAADVRERTRGRDTLLSDFADLPLFVALTNALVKRGVKVAIASFGVYETIQAYCDFAFGEGTHNPYSRENINTPESVGGKDGCSLPNGKNLQLAMLAKWGGGVDPVRIVYFDDDGKNITRAKTAGYPFSFHSPEGFTIELWIGAAQKVVSELRL